MKPYVTEEIARVMAKEVFADAMNRWTEYWRARNRFDIIKDTVITEEIVCWRKIGFRMAGRTSKQIIRGKKIFGIEMNINYLYSSSAVEFIKSTLIHEMAHVIANKYNDSWGHDKTFKLVAQIMGDDGSRCHNYATPENKPQRATVSKKRERKAFTCTKCGCVHNLTPLMQKRCAVGGYQCKCGEPTYKFVK